MCREYSRWELVKAGFFLGLGILLSQFVSGLVLGLLSVFSGG